MSCYFSFTESILSTYEYFWSLFDIIGRGRGGRGRGRGKALVEEANVEDFLLPNHEMHLSPSVDVDFAAGSSETNIVFGRGANEAVNCLPSINLVPPVR